MDCDTFKDAGVKNKQPEEGLQEPYRSHSSTCKI